VCQALLSGSHGNRPVTLIGYSFGARVVFSCLRTLAALVLPTEELIDDNQDCPEADRQSNMDASTENLSSKKEEALSSSSTAKVDIQNLIQDVVFLGSPINAKSRLWKAIRKLVAGRVVNGYSSKDLVLGVVYR
jgi:hypothetical protein